MRNRFARVTPRFETTLVAYRQRFGELASMMEGLDATPPLDATEAHSAITIGS